MLSSAEAVISFGPMRSITEVNKKLRYRGQHSAPVVLSWCAL